VNDIFLNNQLEKANLEAEVDGMFIVECKQLTSVNKPIIQPSNKQIDGLLVAFETMYTPETPILADHSVVKLELEGVTIMVASAAEMDNPSKGIFPKEIWQTSDPTFVNTFHDTYGKAYTKAWVDIYNAFITEFPVYIYFDKPKLELMDERTLGGRFTKRKTRKRKTRKSKTRKRRSKTWSSSR
jgi:hypothetical protein